jgi:F420-0:gamma-glutamyl ligase
MRAEGAGRVEILALAGLPEIRAGDDLPNLIGDALDATRAHGRCVTTMSWS